MSESRESATGLLRLLDQILCVVALHLKSEDLGRMTELLDFIEHCKLSLSFDRPQAILSVS